jgi:hypothetical protein
MITKQYLKDRVQYLHNVTGKDYSLSSQTAGRGRGYSVMFNGSHVCTFGHVTAKELDSAITAFVKGYAEGVK